MANTDIQPPTSLFAVLAYVRKYVSKPETKSRSYKDLQAQIILYTNDRAPLLSFVSKMLNKLVGERDWSAQEVSHILLELPVQEASQTVVTLDCRPEKCQDNVIVLEDGEVSTQRSPVRRYQDRTRDAPGAQELKSVTLFNWLQFWDWKTFTIRTRAPSQVINYWPRYPADPEAATYNNFCCVKLMLHHPFNHIEELLLVNNVVYSSYQEAYTACCRHHSHPEDYYADPETDLDELSNDDEDEEDLEVEPKPEDERPLADFEAYAQRRPDDQGQLDGLGGLGTRHLDREYNWTPHVGKYNINSKDWSQL
jgi:ATP-dependent DNA helicase PIF1